jgi:predicted amino acid racemase
MLICRPPKPLAILVDRPEILNKLIINLDQITTNARVAKSLAQASGYRFVAVLKAVHCHPKLIATLTAAGADSFAFSSVASVTALDPSCLPDRTGRLLLGPSAPSSAPLAITHFGSSIQTTMAAIEALGQAARIQSMPHGVYLALRTADDREGIDPNDLPAVTSLARAVVANGLNLLGLACNLGCTSLDPISAAFIEQMQGIRAALAVELSQDIALTLGGSFLLPNLPDLGGSLSVRVGELLLSGTEPAGRQLLDCATGFRLEANVVEVTHYPTRVLLDVGSAIVEIGGYDILLPAAQTLSMSGEFMVITADFPVPPKVGDNVCLDLGYGSLKKALTFQFLEWCWV